MVSSPQVSIDNNEPVWCSLHSRYFIILEECNDITTVYLDRERRAALIISRRSILCNTSRGVIVLPLIITGESNELC
jgi:hypothetical protein